MSILSFKKILKRLERFPNREFCKLLLHLLSCDNCHFDNAPISIFDKICFHTIFMPRTFETRREHISCRCNAAKFSAFPPFPKNTKLLIYAFSNLYFQCEENISGDDNLVAGHVVAQPPFCDCCHFCVIFCRAI